MKIHFLVITAVVSTWAASLPECPVGGRLCASQWLELADRTNVKGNLYGQSVTMGNDAILVGNLSSQNATVRDRSKIIGTLVSPSANIGNQVYIKQRLTQSYSPISTQSVSLTAGSQSVTVQNDQQLTLEPGAYGDLMVRARARLYIKRGQYSFKSFKVEPDAYFVLPTCQEGELSISVENQAEFSDRTLLKNAEECAMTLQVGGNLRIGNDLSLAGNLRVAGHVQMGSRVSFQGSIAANTIKVEPNVNFDLMTVIKKIPADSLLESNPNIWSRKEFMQAVFRATESNDQLRVQWEWVQAIAKSYSGRGQGTWKVPVLTVGIPYRLQNGTQIQDGYLAVNGSIEELVKTPTIEFIGISESQLFQGDQILSWQIQWEGESYLLPMGGILSVPAGSNGSKVVQITTRFRSGKTLQNGYILNIQRENATY